MTTAENPACASCPLKGDVPFVPDSLVRMAEVLVLQDRAGDPPVPDRLLGLAKLRRGTNVSFGAALRCVTGPRVPGGKRLEKALAACRAHDDFTGVKIIVACGPVSWKSLGHADWGLSRGYPRQLGAA